MSPISGGCTSTQDEGWWQGVRSQEADAWEFLALQIPWRSFSYMGKHHPRQHRHTDTRRSRCSMGFGMIARDGRRFERRRGQRIMDSVLQDSSLKDPNWNTPEVHRWHRWLGWKSWRKELMTERVDDRKETLSRRKVVMVTAVMLDLW